MTANNGNDNKMEYGDKIEYENTGHNKALFRKYILNNFGIKILSLLVAVCTWMVIVNIEDPYKEKNIVVTVETINEDALYSVNKVYEIVEGTTATVKVRGNKSVVDKLKATDIRATADLSNLSAVNAVAIVPELVKTVSSEVVLECSQVLKVSLEDMESKQVKVVVATEGTPDDGYSVGECLAKPNMVEVTGGKSVIKKIDSVRVSVNVNGASEDFSKRLNPVAYDVNGEKVTSSTLTYGATKIRAVIQILKTKTIPVKIEITGEPADGYEFVKAECLPEEVVIAGAKADLNQVSEVKIPVDITGMKSSSGAIEQNYITQDYLSVDGIEVLSDYAQISLRIEIEKQMEKTIKIPVEDIKFASLKSSLTAEILEPATEVQVVIQGSASALDSLSDSQYTAYVDCEGLKAGRHQLSVKLDLSDSYTLKESAEVLVRISKGADNSEDTAVSATQEPSATPEDTELPENDAEEAMSRESDVEEEE